VREQHSRGSPCPDAKIGCGQLKHICRGVAPIAAPASVS
jgi:hypothetical protein